MSIDAAHPKDDCGVGPLPIDDIDQVVSGVAGVADASQLGLKVTAV